MKSTESRVKWQTLQAAVPCLHSSHLLKKIRSGPERALVFIINNSPDGGSQKVDEERCDRSAFNKFLTMVEPSKASCADLAWIHCSLTNSLHYTTAKDEKRIQNALQDWEGIVEIKNPAAEDVDRVAKKHRLMSGKWMCFPRSDEVDCVWENLCRAMMSGTLKDCTEIKISTASAKDDMHVLVAYTDDYSNEKLTQSIAKNLTSLLPPLKDNRLLYKADIYTHLGIYAKNEYNLKPTIYTARAQESKS